MEKIKVTAQQRANAVEALTVMWPSVPKQNVWRNLMNWSNRGKQIPDCHTVACFGGWCAWWPAFRKQGVVVNPDGMPTLKMSGWTGSIDVSEKLFGYRSMFHVRNAMEADYGFRGSNHALVKNRLQWLIDNSEVA